MLTQDQITQGANRLTASKLTDVDVDQTDSILKMFFSSDLITKYGYDFKTKLAEFDDSSNSKKIAAQIGACLDQLEALTFGVSSFQGGRDALYYKEKDEYWQYVQIIFLKMYDLPTEFSTYDIKRRQNNNSSTTVFGHRVEGC